MRAFAEWKACLLGLVCVAAGCDGPPALGDDTDTDDPDANTGDASAATDPIDPSAGSDDGGVDDGGDDDVGDDDDGDGDSDDGTDTGPEPEPADSGRLFVLGNAEGFNEVVMFARDGEGALQSIGEFPTGGAGTGDGLGSQGALALGPDEHLYVVNAGDDSISSLRIYADHLGLVDVVSSEGVRPTSLAVHGDRLYALNADGPGSIVGFSIDGGRLTPIPEAHRPLSGHEAPAPAQVGVSPDGRALVLTERATDQIVTYAIGDDGELGAPVVNPSEGQTPFGFQFTSSGAFVVSEAFGGGANPGASAASSYRVADGGALWTYSASVPSGQTAACWIAIVGDAFAYTTNTASNTVSGYRIDEEGALTLFAGDGIAADLGEDRGPIDMTVSADAKYLYVLNGGSDDLVGFAIEADGMLTPLPGEPASVPESAVGLAGH